MNKPRHRSSYSREETLQVESACLTVAVTLGAYLKDLCIVGGLVPGLLIDRELPANADRGHPGTNDLDLALAIALLDDKRYAELSERLRQEGFGPDTNRNGNEVLQRWRLGESRVTIDFLIAPTPGNDSTRRIQPLEPDFGALVTRGLELAFDERLEVELDGHTLKGERARRKVPICGPAAFTVLKALAFGDRGEPKDAYDLVYVVRGTPGSTDAIAKRMARHAERHPDIVSSALTVLARDFADPNDIGPRRAAEFDTVNSDELDDAIADFHGYVDDLLSACRGRNLTP